MKYQSPECHWFENQSKFLEALSEIARAMIPFNAKDQAGHGKIFGTNVGLRHLKSQSEVDLPYKT